MTIKSLLAAIATLVLSGAGVVAHAQEVTLKVHHFLPAGSRRNTMFIMPWCDKMAKESGGKLKCQIYPSMQLGGTPPQLYDQVKDGVVDIIWTLPGYTAGRFPLIEVFELPFMMRNAEGTSRALWDYVQAYARPNSRTSSRSPSTCTDEACSTCQRQADQDAGRLEGPEAARADAPDQQDAGRAGRHSGRDARAAGGRVAVQGRDRRRGDALGGRALDQGAGDRQVPLARPIRRCRVLHLDVHRSR